MIFDDLWLDGCTRGHQHVVCRMVLTGEGRRVDAHANTGFMTFFSAFHTGSSLEHLTDECEGGD